MSHDHLRIAHSVDLDDAFMFWALATGRLDPRAYGFGTLEFQAEETEPLNRLASAAAADVVAVSIAHVPALADDYLLLPHGGSVGRGYGPVLVARRPELTLADLRAPGSGLRIGIPGERTTAARLVASAVPGARLVPVPFTATLEAIAGGDGGDGTVDAAVLIHEGRLVYERLGYHLLLDLGAWWAETTGGLPLPLGGNVIRRGLGGETIERASTMLRDAIAYALAHRDEAIDELLPARPTMTRAEADHYLGLYANQDTLDYGADGRLAVERLLGSSVAWA